MSVKRKFRKSKKTKGKSKDNNKHKNNDKRSKIQRKTKKRVLRGGKIQTGQRIVGVRIKGSPFGISTEKCMRFFEKINKNHPYGIPEQELVDGTQGKTDFHYCEEKFKGTTFDWLIPQVSPPSTPHSEPQEPIIEETDEEREQRLAAEAAEAAAAAAEAEEKRLAEEAAAAEAEEQRLAEKAARKIERKKEAEEQVEIDSKTTTKAGSVPRITLDRANEHNRLATKYQNLESQEEEEDIKEIYREANKYHFNAYSTLIARWNEQNPNTPPPSIPTSNVEDQTPVPILDVSEKTTDVEKTNAGLDAANSKKMQQVIENVRLGNAQTEQINNNLEAKKKALAESDIDMQTSTEEIKNNPEETLRLAETHGALAKKYEELANKENDEKIKEIYMNSKEYHDYFYNTLQKAAEFQELKKKEEQAAQAPIEPEIIDDLKLFPSACFGKYSICKNELNKAENQSYFFYTFLKLMKIFFIKKSTLIDFDSILSSKNVPRFSASPNFIDQYLNFFEFYNKHMADGDDTKKFVVKIEDEHVIVSQDDENKEKYIVIEQYPNIDLKTFFDNCNKLYDLSLPQVCNFRLAELAYNEKKFVEDFNSSLTPQQMTEKLDNFTPTIFIPTSIEVSNLQKIIKLLTLYHNGYGELLSKPEYQKISSYLKQYNSILPPSPYFSESILPVIRDTSGHSLLDFIDFIIKYQLLYPRYSVTCVTFRDTTRADIRSGFQDILTDDIIQKIREIVDSGDIFKSTCQFIAENPNIKTEIIQLIKNNNTKITNPGIGDFPSDNEKTCAAKSESFVRELENPSSDFKTNIFFHMIIFACYNTKINEKRWGIKGTTLMILFMNIFIINFFNNILYQVNSFCLRFFQQANDNQVSVILIDKNVSTLLEYIEALEPFLLGL